MADDHTSHQRVVSESRQMLDHVSLTTTDIHRIVKESRDLVRRSLTIVATANAVIAQTNDTPNRMIEDAAQIDPRVAGRGPA